VRQLEAEQELSQLLAEAVAVSASRLGRKTGVAGRLERLAKRFVVFAGENVGQPRSHQDKFGRDEQEIAKIETARVISHRGS
jgi:hypothetical protein